MTSFTEKIFNGLFKLLLMFAALPFMIVINAFKSMGDMGGHMIADHRIQQEKERGVIFVSTDEEFTRIN